MLLHDRIFKAIADGSGAFQHSHTYTGHPLACAAALAVQRVIRRDDLLANVRKQGAHFSRGGCRNASAIIPSSAMCAAAACSRASSLWPTAAPRNRSTRRASCTRGSSSEAMARGLMVYPMGGTVDGTRGDHVLLAPPFIIDSEAIDTIVERLGDAIDAATAAK